MSSKHVRQELFRIEVAAFVTVLQILVRSRAMTKDMMAELVCAGKVLPSWRTFRRNDDRWTTVATVDTFGAR